MILKRKYPRSSGVLLPVTTLHGPFGIGVLGAEAMEFIDFLSDAGFHAWQVLPVEHTAHCNSPYKGISAFAGEPILIDPRMLLEMGFITDEELAERMDGVSDFFVEHDQIREKQWKVLRTAFSRVEGKPYRDFNPFWLDGYTLFIAIKQHYGYLPWYQWPDEGLRSHDEAALKKFRKEHSEELEFHRFVQWIFDIQWRKLREYASERGISLIGDMPIYVSEDSAEVWSRRELFDADENGNFAAIGGVPPDYFTPDGQCWGNPIYNWKLLKEEGYDWWISRLKETLTRYDVVRLDHFRGFESYWRIPGGSVTARKGKWVKGPGMSLFNALKNALGDLSLSIIAEDLGDIDIEVEEFLENTGFRGMRVLQFGFLGEELHLPHNFTEDCVAYTGTHDNTTLLAWLFTLSQEHRKKALFYIGFEGDWSVGGPWSPVIKSWIRTLFISAASLAIVPIQDLLGYGSDTRINIPGTPLGNWRFRIRRGVFHEIDTQFYRTLHELSQRIDLVKEFTILPEPEEPRVVEYEAE